MMRTVPVAAFPVVVVTLLASVVQKAAGWRTWGVLPSSDVFALYVGKFCFDYVRDGDERAGEFTLTVAGKVLDGPHQSYSMEECYGACETQGNLYFMVFDDEQDHWAQARRNWQSLSCEQMHHASSFSIALSPLNGEFNRTVVIRESVRPRFWYYTFAACGVTIEEPIYFDIHAKNIRQGYQSEFSLDEEGCLSLQLCFAFLFLGLVLMLRQTATRSTGAEALRSRPLLRLLLVSAVFSAGCASMLAFHYAIFSMNGYGVVLLEVIGQVFGCIAKALLTMLMLLTAKGWALFYAPEELSRRRCMLGILAAIIGTSLSCEIHADYFHDWSTTLYLYESPSGMMILFLNVILFAEAFRSMRDTYRHETSEEVRIFYGMVSMAVFLYFLTLPMISLLAVALDPWVRAKYVMRAEVISRFCTTLLLAVCLKPSRLDAMVNARLEEGLETVGEMRDDLDEDEDEEAYYNENERKNERSNSDEGVSDKLLGTRGRGGSGYAREEMAPAE